MARAGAEGNGQGAVPVPDVEAWRRRIRENTFSRYHHAMGKALVAEGSTQAGLEALRRAVAADPSYGPAHSELIDLLDRLGLAQDALEARERAERLAPHYRAEALAEKSQALVGKDDAEGLALIEEAARLAPDAPEILSQYGLHLRRLGRTKDATSVFERALSLNPNLAGAHFHLGEDREGRWLYAEAAEHYQKALDLGYQSVGILTQLAQMRLGLAQFEAAEAMSRRALALGSGIFSTKMFLALSLAAQGRFDEAIPIQEQCIELAPEVLPLRSILANILLLSGRVEESLRMHEEILAADPQFPNSLSYYGLALLAAGRVEDGLRLTRLAVVLEPAVGWCEVNFALALQRVGQRELAETVVRRMVSVEPIWLKFQAYLRPMGRDWLLPICARHGL